MGIDDRDYMRARYRQRQKQAGATTWWNDRKFRREYRDDRRAPRSGRRGWMANGGNGLLLLLCALPIAVPAYRDAKRSGWLPDYGVELPFPASGTVTVNDSVDPRSATSRIHVIAGPANAVVQLLNSETEAHVISVYVKRAEETSVPVPPGVFRVKIIEGDKWHGLNKWFGPSTTYETVVRPMTFTRLRYHTINLHRSPAGNLPTKINITDPEPLN